MSSFILVFYCFLADSCIQSPRGRSKKSWKDSKKKAKAKRERTERINSNPTIVAKRARSFHVNTVHNQYLNNLRRKKKKPSVYPLVEFRPKQYNRTSQSKNRGDVLSLFSEGIFSVVFLINRFLTHFYIQRSSEVHRKIW